MTADDSMPVVELGWEWCKPVNHQSSKIGARGVNLEARDGDAE